MRSRWHAAKGHRPSVRPGVGAAAHRDADRPRLIALHWFMARSPRAESRRPAGDARAPAARAGDRPRRGRRRLVGDRRRVADALLTAGRCSAKPAGQATALTRPTHDRRGWDSRSPPTAIGCASARAACRRGSAFGLRRIRGDRPQFGTQIWYPSPLY